MKEILPQGLFPPPTVSGLKQFLKWDDWMVVGLIGRGKAGEHGQRIVERNHYRRIYHTPEVCTEKDVVELTKVKAVLGDLVVAEEPATKSWYKTGSDGIPVLSKVRSPHVQPLSKYSKVIAGMLEKNNQVLLCVDGAHRQEAEVKLETGDQQI
jgi:hypothetical protein